MRGDIIQVWLREGREILLKGKRRIGGVIPLDNGRFAPGYDFATSDEAEELTRRFLDYAVNAVGESKPR